MLSAAARFHWLIRVGCAMLRRQFRQRQLASQRIVIFQHPGRSKPLKTDEDLYECRHLVENFFGKFKDFKRIAMRACKTGISFTAMINLVATAINLR